MRARVLSAAEEKLGAVKRTLRTTVAVALPAAALPPIHEKQQEQQEAGAGAPDKNMQAGPPGAGAEANAQAEPQQLTVQLDIWNVHLPVAPAAAPAGAGAGPALDLTTSNEASTSTAAPAAAMSAAWHPSAQREAEEDGGAARRASQLVRVEALARGWTSPLVMVGGDWNARGPMPGDAQWMGPFAEGSHMGRRRVAKRAAAAGASTRAVTAAGNGEPGSQQAAATGTGTGTGTGTAEGSEEQGSGDGEEDVEGWRDAWCEARPEDVEAGPEALLGPEAATYDPGACILAAHNSTTQQLGRFDRVLLLGAGMKVRGERRAPASHQPRLVRHHASCSS